MRSNAIAGGGRRGLPGGAGSLLSLCAGLVGGAAVARVFARTPVAGVTVGPSGIGTSPSMEAEPVRIKDSITVGRYEFRSCVIWSDNPRLQRSDIENAEGIEDLVDAGWELVHVIVPFAQMRFLEAGGYPGNTRKLIAYFRRPKEAFHDLV